MDITENFVTASSLFSRKKRGAGRHLRLSLRIRHKLQQLLTFFPIITKDHAAAAVMIVWSVAARGVPPPYRPLPSPRSDAIELFDVEYDDVIIGRARNLC